MNSGKFSNNRRELPKGQTQFSTIVLCRGLRAMAETVSVAEIVKKLADQLECSICLDSFTDPKLLQCFHVFCKDCLEPLALRDQHGLSLRCPNCRRSTLLPANGVSGLQPAFHVHHLFDIRDALQKVKQGQEGQKTLCEKCNKRDVNGFCRDCGEFICNTCMEMHQTWKELSTHKVISLQQLKSDATEMVPPTKKTLYCSKHPGKELDLFCETDKELICQHCIVKTHRDHQYDLVSEAFPKHRDAIVSHLEPVRQQLNTVNKAIHGLGTTQDQLVDQRAAIEADIQRKTGQLHEAIEVRKTELIGELDKMTQQKLKTLSIQRDELELVQTRLNSCLQFVNDSLKTGSEGEILVMEKPVVQQVKEMCAEYDPSKLQPCEQADMALSASSELLPACQQFGQVYSHPVCPEKCYATVKGLEVATVGEQSTVTVHAIDAHGSMCAKPLPLISCELVPSSGERMKSEVKPSKSSEYQVDYRPTRRGRHQLHIKVCDQHIRGSPFAVVALRKLEAPTRTITGLNDPWGVAVDKRGQIIISEHGGHCISIYSSGKRIRSFGQKGSAPGQFKDPLGVAVDRAGNILVVDGLNHRFQKFTADGEFITSVGSNGSKPLQFRNPVGICISPSEKVYICEHNNQRVQILNPDLTFSIAFGSRGSGDGQFQNPWDIAFDSRGNVYVADSGNHRIQVFTEDGRFLRKFGKKGGGDGELTRPASVAIDSDNVAYVTDSSNHRISLFTSEGHFLRSFGTQGEGPGQFNNPHGIAVDKDGLVYVCDWCNDCLQIL